MCTHTSDTPGPGPDPPAVSQTLAKFKIKTSPPPTGAPSGAQASPFAMSRSRSRSPHGAPSTAATEIDSDSDMHDDPYSPVPPAPSAPMLEVVEISSEYEQEVKENVPSYVPESLVPFWSWTNMRLQFHEIQQNYIDPNHDIQWALAPPCCASRTRDAFDHVKIVLNDTLSNPRFRHSHFKFGITSLPEIRFNKGDYIHCQRMIFVYTTENSDKTAELETLCITEFKDIARDPRCENQHPGGENAHMNFSPHFMYIVMGTHSQFMRGRGCYHKRELSS